MEKRTRCIVYSRNLQRSPSLWKGHTQVNSEVYLSKIGIRERVFFFLVKSENKSTFLSLYLFSPSFAFQCLCGKPSIVTLCSKF